MEFRVIPESNGYRLQWRFHCYNGWEHGKIFDDVEDAHVEMNKLKTASQIEKL